MKFFDTTAYPIVRSPSLATHGRSQVLCCDLHSDTKSSSGELWRPSCCALSFLMDLLSVESVEKVVSGIEGRRDQRFPLKEGLPW